MVHSIDGLERAEIMRLLGSLREAASEAELASVELADFSPVFAAEAFHELGEFEKSPGRFIKAMTLSPDLAPIAQYYSGVAFFRRGILDEARTAFEAAIERIRRQTGPTSRRCDDPVNRTSNL